MAVVLRALLAAIFLGLSQARLNYSEQQQGSLHQKTASIVGGKHAKPNQIPYQVYVRTFTDDAVIGCGGSIISPIHVLTAAHCVNKPIVLKVMVVYGDVDKHGRRARSTQVLKKYIYKTKTKDIGRDIAILKVKNRFPLHLPNVKAVQLQRERNYLSNACIVSGWGDAMDDYQDKDWLKAVVVPIFGYYKCRRIYSKDPPEDLLCAGFYKGGKDSCQGDSGGPLVCEGLLTGIVKGGVGCALPGYPGTYTEVAYYYNWIKEVVEEDIKASGDYFANSGYFYKSSPYGRRKSFKC